ncbi:MAG: Type pili twitching motility protein PilT [Patescibacteria group bacterium]|nr:Type pili twitching motility protein PilT [Patescibacteria group bacterium]
MIEKFHTLLDDIIENKFPDLHISSGACPTVRKHNGELETVTAFGETSVEDVYAFARVMLGSVGYAAFIESKEADFSYAFKEHRFRVNAFHDVKGPGLAMRYISTRIPTPEELSIPKPMMELLHREKGLILVTGPTGSGKSTTLASMIEYINTHFKKHIITIEDPIEFNLVSKDCLIHQREVGTHTQSFARAIKSSLREDPDVILVGEMRDPETMQAALTLAETGHLVLSTLHTNDTVQSVDRIIDAFPSNQQSQIRVQLAMALTAVVSQALLPRKDGTGRVVCREVLINNDAVRSVVLRGLTHQLYSIIELGAQEGMILMDRYLENLFMKGHITRETFASLVRDKDLVAQHR